MSKPKIRKTGCQEKHDRDLKRQNRYHLYEKENGTGKKRSYDFFHERPYGMKVKEDVV